MLVVNLFSTERLYKPQAACSCELIPCSPWKGPKQLTSPSCVTKDELTVPMCVFYWGSRAAALVWSSRVIWLCLGSGAVVVLCPSEIWKCH